MESEYVNESLRRDFETLRKNSWERRPKTFADFIEFLNFAQRFGRPILRHRPVDAGRCLL